MSQDYIDAIVRASNNLLKFSVRKKGAIRFSLVSPEIPSPHTSEDIGEKVLKKLKWGVLKKIPPGTKQSASGMFSTFIVGWNGQKVKTVFARGGNRGHFFEKDVDKDKQLIIAPLATRGIINKLFVWNLRKNTNNPSRPFTGICENVGSTIADKIIENSTGSKVFVSLKNTNRGSVANFGYRGATFNPKTSKIQVGDNQTSVEQFLWSVARKDCYSQGLNAWGNRSYTKVELLTRKKQKRLIEEAIHASIGFGYVMVFGDGNVLDFRTQHKLLKTIGTVTGAVVKYPGTTTKQLSIEAITDRGHRFVFALRNSHGEVIPDTVTLNATWKF